MKIEYKNQIIGLNEKLIEKQELNDNEVQNIINLHKKRIDIFENAESLSKKAKDLGEDLKNSEELILELQNLSKSLEELEFEMQKTWHFDENKNMHTWWYQIPGCSCPVLDNRDLMGIDKRYINDNCIYHGSKYKG